MSKLVLMIALATISNLAAADLSGKWTGTMETNGSRVRIFVTLNLFDPSTGGQQHVPLVSGTVATGDDAKPVPVEKAEINGDTVTFQVHDNAGKPKTENSFKRGSSLNPIRPTHATCSGIGPWR